MQDYKEIKLLDNPKYYLALTTIFRDEARFLKEYIEFYKLMGVEHFYLFNHLSKDNYLEVLSPYIAEGVIDLIDLLYDPKDKEEWYRKVQNPAYSKISRLVENDVEWLIVVDTDEFLYPVKDYDLPSVLINYDSYASISVGWKIFGSGDIQFIKEDELMIEKLLLRSKFSSHVVKSIIKPRYVDIFYDPHYGLMKEGHGQITENYNFTIGSVVLYPSFNILAINHYKARDWTFFNKTKIFRAHIVDQDLKELIANNKKDSSVYDDGILRFAIVLRKKMFGKHYYMKSDIIDFPHENKIYKLPNNLVFLSNFTTDNANPSLNNGYGKDPYLMRKIMAFTNNSKTYIEIGAGYGEFILQMSKKLEGENQVYAFEADNNLFQYLSTNIFLNNISNIKLYKETHDIMNLDKYFNNSSVDFIRINMANKECNILQGMQNITSDFDNIKLLINWQGDDVECLSGLMDKGFIFIDIRKFQDECSDYVYQENYILEINDILETKDLEVLVIKEEVFELYRKTVLTTEECGKPSNYQLAYLVILCLYLGCGQDIIKLYLKSGAYVNYIHEDLTALYLAVEKGFFEAAELLLKNGANPDIKTTTGVAPLCIAAQNNNLSMVKLLVENGADIEISNSNNATALYLAAHMGGFEVVEFLLSRGANKDVIVGGLNTFERSIQDEHYDIAKLLANDAEVFCQAIPELVMHSYYTDLCGEVEISSDGHEL